MAPLKPDLPVGGRLRYFLSQWFSITSDPEVIDMVRGMHIEFSDLPHSQVSAPPSLIFSTEECAAADEHISTLLQKRAIVPVYRNISGGFFSNIFLTPKKDGGFRMILNLKRFNNYVKYSKFKMDHLFHILSHVQQGFYMATFDLTDAYLTVPIAPAHYKFLKFTWKGQVYMYVVMPFGISSAPRKFTKLLKPLLAALREQAIIIIMYLDDGWVIGATFDICLSNISTAMSLFTSVGFLINVKKVVSNAQYMCSKPLLQY